MEDFIPKQEKRIIIVYDEETKESAEYLKTLFSCFNEVKCVSYRLKEYQKNETMITSKENILFLGNSGEIKKYYNFMEPNIICKYGMRYGNKGTRHFMYVEKDEISTKKEYKDFIEYNKKVDENLKKTTQVYFSGESIFDSKMVKGGIAIGIIRFGIIGFFGVLAGKALYDFFEDKKNQEKIKEQQYYCLCNVVCKEIISKM